MAELTQLLCGVVNLFEETDEGKVLKLHRLQVAEGVCSHESALGKPAHPLWAQAQAEMTAAGLTYLGLQGEADWPVHVWSDGGSTHGQVIPPVVQIPLRTMDGITTRWEPDAKPVKIGPCTSSYCLKCSGESALPFLAERVWDDDQSLPPHPPAERVSRDAEPPGAFYPSAVLKLAERAREAGWEVRQQSARGAGTHGSTGRALAVKTTYALIFSKHPLTDAGAYAVHDGKVWKSVNIGGVLIGGISDLQAWLLAGGQLDEAWWAELRARRDAAAVKRKAAPKAKTSGARAESGG